MNHTRGDRTDGDDDYALQYVSSDAPTGVRDCCQDGMTPQIYECEFANSDR